MTVTPSGKLKAKFLPAIYFDSSVLIDYWMTDGLEVDTSEELLEKEVLDEELLEKELRGEGLFGKGLFGVILDESEAELLHIMRKLLKSNRRMKKVIAIRRKILSGESKATVVISPFSLLEVMEWNAEAAFRDFAAQASRALAIQRMGKKQIGDYLQTLLKLRSEEMEKQKGRKRTHITGLECIMGATRLHRSFADCHGLQGLLQADIVNFELTIDKVWQKPFGYAYLQLGVSDIIHILIAQHLGCKYIASFDSDFQRVSDIIAQETGMTVVGSPEEILMLL